MITFGPSFGAAVSDQQEFFFWGYDSSTDKFAAPRKIEFEFGPIANVQTTDDSIFILTASGRIFILSGNLFDSEFVEIILPAAEEPAWWNLWLPGKAKVVSMSAGSRHVAMVDSKGRVFTLGDNLFGQCGRKLPPKKYDRDGTELAVKADTTPIDWQKEELHQVKLQVPALSVACGGRHTMVTTADGVYAFGDDGSIQLGFGDTRFQQADYQPWLSGLLHRSQANVRGLEPPNPYDPIIKFHFYERHCLVTPTKVKDVAYGSHKDFGPAQATACGENFSVFVHNDPKPDWFKTKATVLFSCGDNLNGQCGRNRAKHHQTSMPVRLPKNAEVSMVKCGQGHCLALVDNAKVYGWGMNDRGQLGLGNFVDACPPMVVMGSNLRGPVESVLPEDRETSGKTVKTESFRNLKPDGQLYEPEEMKVTERQIRPDSETVPMSSEEQAKWKVRFIEAKYKNSVIIADR